MDGAGERACFFRITLPNLLPSLYTISVLSFLNSFKVFREAWLVAGDYPQQDMYLLQHLYNNWFRDLAFDKISAAAVLTALVVCVLILLLQRAWERGDIKYKEEREMLMKRTRRGREKSEICIQRKCPVWRVLCSVLLLLLAVLIGFPVWVAVTGVFMQQWELTEYLGPVLAGGNGTASWTLFPHAPTLQWVVELLLDSPQFFVMFWNSMKLAVCILLGQLLFGVPSAWALARFDFPCRKAVLLLYIVLMLMPFQVLMLPEYLVLNELASD